MAVVKHLRRKLFPLCIWTAVYIWCFPAMVQQYEWESDNYSEESETVYGEYRVDTGPGKAGLDSSMPELNSSRDFVFMYGRTAVKVQGAFPSDGSLLFIGIHSGPLMYHRRKAIRRTYLSQRPKGVAYAFILGNPTPKLLSENAIHEDIVFINQTERYTPLDSVLPYKAATIIQLATRMDPRPQWVLKTDDDSYVNLPEVMKNISQLEEDRYYGHGMFGMYAIRTNDSKWYVTEAFWPGNLTYPPFCVGAGYFMSKKAYTCAATIFTKPSHKYFPREDVLNGIFMQSCNITATTLAGVLNHSNATGNFLIKHYVKDMITFQKIWHKLSYIATVSETSRLLREKQSRHHDHVHKNRIPHG